MEEIARMWKNFWMLFTSNKVRVLVGEPIFRFNSYDDWFRNARVVFDNYEVEPDDVLCLDAYGRVCNFGEHFLRAQDDDCYPIVAYEVL